MKSAPRWTARTIWLLAPPTKIAKDVSLHAQHPEPWARLRTSKEIRTEFHDSDEAIGLLRKPHHHGLNVAVAGLAALLPQVHDIFEEEVPSGEPTVRTALSQRIIVDSIRQLQIANDSC